MLSFQDLLTRLLTLLIFILALETRTAHGRTGDVSSNERDVPRDRTLAVRQDPGASTPPIMDSIPSSCTDACAGIVSALGTCVSKVCFCTTDNGRSLESCMNCFYRLDPADDLLGAVSKTLDDFEDTCQDVVQLNLSITTSIPTPSQTSTQSSSSPTSTASSDANGSTSAPNSSASSSSSGSGASSSPSSTSSAPTSTPSQLFPVHSAQAKCFLVSQKTLRARNGGEMWSKRSESPAALVRHFKKSLVVAFSSMYRRR